MKDPMKMLRQVQQMHDRMAKAEAELADQTVSATVGGGAITAVATGTQKLVSITIDPGVATDHEMLQDLVVAAVNEVMERSKAMAATRMQDITSGLGPLGR